ncbi:EAL domain-containing protein [Piscinibacter sp.]|uniref:EAL domain-containing protein n=1 Tax=Piscinibacter sp. TaxID=1903157 RepID=UPI00355ACD77
MAALIPSASGERDRTGTNAKSVVPLVGRLEQDVSLSLRLDVVAEGVETADQLSALRAHGCTRIQGFLFARPSTTSAIVDMLLRR